MPNNTNAIYRAIIGGARGVEGEMPKLADKVQSEFRKVVSIQFPPASEPGTPPHMRTGGYMRSIKAKAINQYAIRVYSDGSGSHNGFLALWLEFGTHRNGRPYMAARPHWRTLLPLIVLENTGPRVADALLKGEYRWQTY